jgi:hypothetical protein
MKNKTGMPLDMWMNLRMNHTSQAVSTVPLVIEGKTADNPILVDCDNQGTNEASAELTINVAGVDPNVISETHCDIAPIAD